MATVIRDANRIYRLFRHRNPSFKGKVSLIGRCSLHQSLHSNNDADIYPRPISTLAWDSPCYGHPVQPTDMGTGSRY